MREIDLPNVLRMLAPPTELLDYLDKVIQSQGNRAPQSIIDYRQKWRKINGGEPFPELDQYDQPTLLDSLPAKYE